MRTDPGPAAFPLSNGERTVIGTVMLLAFVAIISLFTACAQLGIAAPQSLAEKVTVTVTAVTGVREAANTLLVAKKISVQDAENIQKQANAVREAAELALQIGATNPAAGETKLTQARSALAALQAYLAAKQGG